MNSRRRPKPGVLEISSASGLEIRQLRAFVALVERRRVTAAAEALDLAQSTVSEALSALERVLGTTVILRRRGGRALELTEAGRALLPHARKILAAVNAAHVAVGPTTTSRTHAKVAIVANESVSSYLLPEILPALRQRWPRTRFTVSVATCAGVREGVAGGAFDVGLLLAGPKDSGVQRRAGQSPKPFVDRRVVTSSVPLVLFATGSHPLIRRQSSTVRIGALCGYPLFVSDAAGDFHDLVHRFFLRRGADGPTIEASGSIEGVKKAVRDDRAIGLLPLYTVTEELRAATIAQVNLRPAPPRMRIDALLTQSRAHHPSLEELIAAIRSRVAGLAP